MLTGQDGVDLCGFNVGLLHYYMITEVLNVAIQTNTSSSKTLSGSGGSLGFFFPLTWAHRVTRCLDANVRCCLFVRSVVYFSV